MTADGDRQPIRHRRRMHSPALRYGENGRSGTRGSATDSRGGPARSHSRRRRIDRCADAKPWLDARLARCRGSSSIVDEYLPSLWLTPSPPTTVPSIPTAPAIASLVVAVILGPMGPEFQRLLRREDGRRVPPDDDTVVVLRRRRRGSRATTC